MKPARLLIPLGALLIGAVTGFLIRDASLQQKNRNSYIQRREGQLRYINPLLECDIAEDVLRNQELSPFKEKISKFLRSRMGNQGVRDVSVYFRQLNDGLWFSIGDTERFVPASLRKVPLMIALLKQDEESNGAFLNRRVKLNLSRDYNRDQNIKPSRSLTPGQEYSIRDLIHHMIVYSDNNAFMVLGSVVDSRLLDSVYATLRVQNPRTRQDDYFLSVQTYASFFRILYNATYLDRQRSDWALETMGKSEFTPGLVAGVPRGVPVSHKFGEHSDVGEGTVQLHDCGIVYYPNHPYMLCVMSKGTDFQYLDDVIAEVSRLTWNEIETQHTK